MSIPTNFNLVRLVAVSKKKTVSDIMTVYSLGHRHFGENYIQELIEKASVLPKDINWHFIGTFQSNKAKALADIPNLWAIESLDSVKRANALNASLINRNDPLNVFLQINTSGEVSKSGCDPLEVQLLARHVLEQCPKLKLFGVMTIGESGWVNDGSDSKNPDFLILQQICENLESLFGVKLELSMGMSDDYELAIRMGSTNGFVYLYDLLVRVGSKIFGAR